MNNKIEGNHYGIENNLKIVNIGTHSLMLNEPIYKTFHGVYLESQIMRLNWFCGLLEKRQN